MKGIEKVKREHMLKMHMSDNFFPPLAMDVQREIVKAFKEYWKGEIELSQEMADKMKMRDVETIYHYFGDFLKEEEFEDA